MAQSHETPRNRSMKVGINLPAQFPFTSTEMIAAL